MHIQVCHTSSHPTVCKQEVHFKKRLKTFKPLGSANGDGAGEGKNSRQRRNLQARKRRFSGKILKSGPLRVHFQLSGAKIREFVGNTDIKFIPWQHTNTLFKLGWLPTKIRRRVHVKSKLTTLSEGKWNGEKLPCPSPHSPESLFTGYRNPNVLPNPDQPLKEQGFWSPTPQLTGTSAHVKLTTIWARGVTAKWGHQKQKPPKVEAKACH